MQQIERRRNEMLRDQTEIQVVDFGAGAATDNFSLEDQKNGRFRKSTVAQSARASKPELRGRFLHHLASSRDAKNVLEMGTCVGVSGAYIASALKGGKLTTLEGDPERGRISTETFAKLGLSDRTAVIVGPFHLTLKRVLDSDGPFDLIFVDGHHDGDATIQYFETLLDHLTPNGIIVFDDIRWSEGMKKGWDVIASHPKITPIDMGAIGAVKLAA